MAMVRSARRLKVIQQDPATYADTVFKVCKKLYPDATIPLNFKSPLELLVAAILSAQCTDAQVNVVTSTLFKQYPTVKDYANADPAMFEQEISSVTFYRNKAKNIINAAKMIVSDFNGKVPDTMVDLLKLPGVARKTANVVLANAFNKQEGIVVDTHVIRVSYRLGLTDNVDPVKIEGDLMGIVPRKNWTKFAHVLSFHGRKTCKAPIPHCGECPLNATCPSSRIP